MMERHRTLAGHEGGVLCVTMSSNGAYVISGAQDRKLMLWNADSGKRVTVFDGHSQAVRDVQVTRDSAQLASGGQDKTLLLWDVSRGTITRKIRAHDGEVNGLRFSVDAAVVVTGGADKHVNVWDLRSRSNRPIQVRLLGGGGKRAWAHCVSRASAFKRQRMASRAWP